MSRHDDLPTHEASPVMVTRWHEFGPVQLASPFIVANSHARSPVHQALPFMVVPKHAIPPHTTSSFIVVRRHSSLPVDPSQYRTAVYFNGWNTNMIAKMVRMVLVTLK
eukprot:43918_1